MIHEVANMSWATFLCIYTSGVVVGAILYGGLRDLIHSFRRKNR